MIEMKNETLDRKEKCSINYLGGKEVKYERQEQKVDERSFLLLT
ncbi:hypothetical protein [Metabacillus sp. Hm71]